MVGRQVAVAASFTGVLFNVVSVEGRSVSAQSSLEAAWSRELDERRVNPIRRVINLLTKMRTELQEEADKESDMYEKMVCWCTTNEKEKVAAVKAADAKDLELTAEIEERAGKMGHLGASIENLKKETAENAETLKTTRDNREEEATKFRESEKDQMQAVVNLKNAIAVLSKHQGASLLQMDGSMLSSIRVLLRDAALRYEVIMASRAERNPARQGTASLIQEHREGDSQATGAADAALMSALDVHGADVSDTLSLKFAAQIVEHALKRNSKPKQAFLQAGDDQPIYSSRSSSRSSGIFGILTQMLEEFEASLSQEQKDEIKAKENYEALTEAKTAELEAGKEKLDKLEEQASGNAKALSDAKEDLEITREQRSKDQEFLRNLQTTCNDLDTQWEKRSQTRTAEIKAVGEAMAIITEDDNRELLSKSTAFVQLTARRSADHTATVRSNAANFLRRVAESPDFDADELLSAWHDRKAASIAPVVGPRNQLSMLSSSIKLDAFTKVIAIIDKMVEELKAQHEEEVAFKANCTKELTENEKTTYKKDQLRKNLEADMEQLQTLMDRLAKEIAEAQDNIAKTEVEIKKASQTREQENKEFQSVVSDQRATQNILHKAVMKLKDFYEKNIGSKVLFVQRSSQTPPVQFNDYGNNKGATPVIGLIEQIIEDAAALEKEAITGETEAQASYETFVKDSNGLIQNLQDAITSKSKASAAAKSDHAQANTDHENTVGELESLEQYKADLHGQCDFVLKNFDVRQKARSQEIEAIQAAKAMLKGSAQES